MIGRIQRMAVSFDYPVTFTRDAFAAANPARIEAMTWKEPSRKTRELRRDLVESARDSLRKRARSAA